jgi:hypothetical protein
MLIKIPFLIKKSDNVFSTHNKLINRANILA